MGGYWRILAWSERRRGHTEPLPWGVGRRAVKGRGESEMRGTQRLCHVEKEKWGKHRARGMREKVAGVAGSP